MNESGAASFTGLIDLAAASLGGRAVATSDDFFAEMNNLVAPGRGVFIEGKFTDRGKWMDGWESRRKRQPGYDWCVLELGAAGKVLGLDVDTNHFVGNCPSFASVDGVRARRGAPAEELLAMTWTELLPQSALRPGAQNLFAAAAAEPVTHVRLNIFPDGGVARFRVFGRVEPAWNERAGARDAETDAQVPPSLVDLAAVTNGGLALACSDAFFGPMNNLLLPGRAENMGGGWETRRKRGPGHDWILVQLGARGSIQVAEVDTNHFKGNYPDRCSNRARRRAGRAHHRPDREPRVGAALARDEARAERAPLLPRAARGRRAGHARAAQRLPRRRHQPPAPLGGARMTAAPHARVNAASREEAATLLLHCGGSTLWAERMLAMRPFASAEALHEGADRAWEGLGREDLLEAFGHHPRLGADLAGLRARFAAPAWSAQEQAGVARADEATLEALRAGNEAYEERFGFVFLVCATGKGAAEILALLEQRIGHDADTELRVAAGELAKIAHLRLDKLGEAP